MTAPEAWVPEGYTPPPPDAALIAEGESMEVTWHRDPATGEPVPGHAPVSAPGPDPQPRPPWQHPPGGDNSLADWQKTGIPPDHPVMWMLVPGGGPGGIDLSRTQLRMPVDDMPAAGMVAKMADGHFRHITDRKTWHYWDGRYHPADADDFIRRAVQHFAWTYAQALQVIEAASKDIASRESLKAREQALAQGASTAEAETQADKRFGQVMEKIAGFLGPQFKYGKQLLNNPVQERVYKQMTALLGTDGARYDQDKTLVNFADGTFELGTGTFREHRREDMLTSLMDLSFVPGAWAEARLACPMYLSMMTRLSGGDRELLRYNLGVESLGLISGNPGERIFFRCGGSNMGKSVCSAVTGMLAGDRWYPASAELLGIMQDKGRYRHASVLSTLEGATYVTVDETARDLVLDAGTLKMLTSTTFMPGTELYKAKQQKMPRDWTIVANANTGELPRIPRLDTGLERRLRVIPVPDADPEQTRLTERYADVILAEEGAAVASLLISMASWVLRYGLPEPPAVAAATDAYFDSCDPRRGWVRARIMHAPGRALSSSEAWKEFIAETGYSWSSQTDFSLYLQSRGWKIQKDSRGLMMILDAALLQKPQNQPPYSPYSAWSA